MPGKPKFDCTEQSDEFDASTVHVKTRPGRDSREYYGFTRPTDV